jgi:hypothetical protein
MGNPLQSPRRPPDLAAPNASSRDPTASTAATPPKPNRRFWPAPPQSLSPARHPEGDRSPSAARLAQQEEDDSINDLDDLPDHTLAEAAEFGLYDAYEEADKW